MASGALADPAFLFLYKLGDNMATALATPFYIDMGYSQSEIGIRGQGGAALWASIAGGVLGGIIMLKISINRALWLFGFVQLITISLLLAEPSRPHADAGCSLAVSGEYLGVGLGTIALTAFMARETSRAFTATQFALFTSFIAIPPHGCQCIDRLHRGSRGVDAVLRHLCPAAAIPGMLLLLKVAPGRETREFRGNRRQRAG